MLLVLLAPTVCRFKYYFGWNLAETAFVACGISYNGFGIEWQEANKADDKPVTGSTPGPRWERYAYVLALLPCVTN